MRVADLQGRTLVTTPTYWIALALVMRRPLVTCVPVFKQGQMLTRLINFVANLPVCSNPAS